MPVMGVRAHNQSRRVRVRVAEAGRVVIPAELRKEVGIEEGQDVLLCRDGNEIRIIPVKEAVRQAQEYFMSLAPGDIVVSDELIRDRREEASREALE
jgi:AbrB family looped-hinge helix DNA binding protein